MIILLLIRRLSPRTRTITGAVLTAAGMVLVGVSVTLAAGLLVHGIVLIVIGAVLWTSAVVTRRRARLANQSLAKQPNTGVL
jgi:drug/metabolite transporter (DMT)-like permease